MNHPVTSGLVVVVGSANMDLVVRVPRLPNPGETLMGEHFETVHGGKGANQAVAAARSGASVAMVGCVGNDAFGASLRRGACGANSIVVAAGANASLGMQHIDAARELIARADLMICQLEVPRPTVEHAIELAARSGTEVLDTTAAGDTFAGGFAAARVSGASIGDAIAFGQRAAAISVTRRGARTSIPSRAEVTSAFSAAVPE